MKRVPINNFCGNDPIEVSAFVHETCGPMVNVTQRAAAFFFNHLMRPGQAREMAEALNAAADGMEAMAAISEVPA